MLAIEALVLNYLAENIGQDDTFRPACAYVNENAINAQIGRDINGDIYTVTAMRIDVIYTTKESFKMQLEAEYAQLRKSRQNLRRNGGGGGRDLQDDGGAFGRSCDTTNHHLCCSQKSINADVGGYCRALGCNIETCGARGLAAQRPPRPDRPGGTITGRPPRPAPITGRPPRPESQETPQVEEPEPQPEPDQGGNAGGDGVPDGTPNRPPNR